MKNEEAANPPKAPYEPPTLQKRQRVEEVLGAQLAASVVLPG